MAINDTLLLSVRGTLQGQQYIHTQHLRQMNTIVVGENAIQALIDSWQANGQAAWLAAHQANYQLVDIRGEYVCGSVPLPAPVEEAVGTPGVRATGGQALAPWLSIVVTERTPFAGRSYRGRFFVSGGGEEDVNGDALITAAGSWHNLVTGYAGALFAAYGPGGTQADNFRMVVHSPLLAGATPPPQCTVSSSLITSVSVGSVLATQKSRRG